MVKIRFEVDTPLSPQEVMAAATDFSERRPQIWSGIDPKHFRVHALGDRTAEGHPEHGDPVASVPSRQLGDSGLSAVVRTGLSQRSSVSAGPR